MKTKKVVELYNILKSSHLTKCEDADKFLMVKNINVIKPVAVAYTDFFSDAQERLKDDRYDEMQKKVMKWQQEGDKTTLTPAEQSELNSYFFEHSKKIEACMKEESDKDIDISLHSLSEKAFQSFIASNDFTLEQCGFLSEFFV